MAEVKMKINATATLRSLAVGESVKIPLVDIKYQAVRRAKDRLEELQPSIKFEVSEKGLRGECRVTRLS